MELTDVTSWVLLLAGSFFCIVGGIGLVRLPDFFARIHGAGITDTLGAGLVLAGLMVQAGLTLVTVKLVMVVAILLITGPTATHAVARAARLSGLEPVTGEEPSDP
jgi:multicomponent Na+:H+ antiporter subunit G